MMETVTTAPAMRRLDRGCLKSLNQADILVEDN